ncbi:MAG: hypothetical protein IJA62_00990 [Ruminococcus sp.]|nr:hypothetical protein [Ruminococcus sp.]
MKNLICLIAAAVMLCSLFACNQTGEEHTHSHDHTHNNTSAQEPASAIFEEDKTQVPQIASEASESAETQAEGSDPKQETSAPFSENTELSQYPFTKEAEGVLMKRHSDKIDSPFEQEYLDAENDKELARICEEYTEKWRTIAERYFKELLYYNGSVPETPDFSTDAQMHGYVEDRKARWEEEYEENHSNYLAQLLKQYSDADKAQALCAAYKFDMQREFALEMIGIYEMLGEFNNQEF